MLARVGWWSLVSVAVMAATGCVGPDEHEYSDLEAAIIDGSDLADVRGLLEAGEDPNAGSGGGGPLGAAVGRSEAAVVDLLVSYGADVQSPDAPGGSYLVVAATDRPRADEVADVEIVRLLVDAGADPCVRSTSSRTSGLRLSEIAEQAGRTTLAAVLRSVEESCG